MHARRCEGRERRARGGVCKVVDTLVFTGVCWS